MRILLTILLLPGCLILSFGQDAPWKSMKPKKPIICYAKDANQFTQIPPPETYREWVRNASGRVKTANFEVNYVGFSEDAQRAFQQAVDIWETLITSPVTIHVTAQWRPLGSGVLGSAIWGTAHMNFPGAQRVNTWYPVALAEKMAGKEINDSFSDPDIFANFNSNANWFLGTTGTPPAGQYDLVTVVMHELGHGLGFVDSYSVEGSVGTVGLAPSGLPMIYDHHLENNAAQNIYSHFVNNTPELKAELTSGAVFFNSPTVITNNGGARARIYAPLNFDGGSSISHLDEANYPSGNANSLMTPQIGATEVIHNPGPITLSAFSDMGWVFTYIDHNKLADTEDVDGPYVVTAKIKSDAGAIAPAQIKLFYTIGGTETPVVMAATANPDQYQAVIPATGSPTTYGYYISVTDNANRSYTNPGKILEPGHDLRQTHHVFATGPDIQGPVITHAAETFILETDVNLVIEAIITDNLGVGQATVEYKVNGTNQPNLPMALIDAEDSLYRATINVDGLQLGDQIAYRIVAVDNAVAHNQTTDPGTGYHEVNVTGLAETKDFYANNFDSPSDDFFGEGFSITTPAGFSNPAIHSNHPYSEGNGFPNNQLNWVYQLRYPIRVQAGEANIKFDEIVLVEPGAAGSVFGDEDFFDYVVVEGSLDGGVTWTPVANGYDARASSDWLTRYNSAITANNSTAVGDPTLFHSRTIDLLDEFDPGQVVAIRFRLFSDPFARGWGWAIDNLKIQIDETPPTIFNDHVDYVPPGEDILSIKTRATDVSGIQKLGVESKVNGGDIQLFEFAIVPNVFEYTLNLTLENLSPGDQIEYRITATDSVGNVNAFPSIGFILVPLVEFGTAVNAYVNNFNTATPDFVGNFFSINTVSGFTDGLLHTDNPYAKGFGLDSTSNFTKTLIKPVVLGNNNPWIRFDEVVIVEGHAAGAIFGTAEFNDYVIVEGSDDAGQTWRSFLDGYDAVGESAWVNALDKKNNGTSLLFRERLINILENGEFEAGQEVLIRFRLFSDKQNTGWGWAIDNLSIQGPVTSVESPGDSDLKVYPNPARNILNLELPPTQGGETEWEIVNIHGKQVYHSRINNRAAVHEIIDVEALAAGLYIFRVHSNGRQIVRKFVKTN